MYLDARRLSLGLLDGATDIIGGDPLQEPVEKDFTSDANGHIIIPAADGGGIVTWIRGVWDYGTQFRYNDFMAGTEDPNATNYAAPNSAAVCTNLYEGGIYFTRLEPVGTAPNTQYHVRYSRRSGQTVGKGSPINGWPYNYVDPDYLGTAVDGDMYVMWACEMAYAAFNDPKYRNLAQYIGNANKAAGAWSGNRIDFNLPYAAEAGEVGVYEYNGPNTPFTATRVARPDQPGYCLKIDTAVVDGATPANYAGWGVWPTWNITTQEPFHSIDFEFDGGGVGRNVELTTNARDDDPTAEVAVLIPCLTSLGGVFTPYSITPDQFWSIKNVVWECQHKTPFYIDTYGSDLNALDTFETASAIVPRFQFDFSANPTGYAGVYVGVDTGVTDSTGTSSITVDLKSNVSGLVRIRVDDANNVTHQAIVSVSAGVRAQHTVLWSAFTLGPVVHPIDTVRIVPDDHDAGVYELYGAWFDSVVTMANMTITAIGGFEFQFPSHSAEEAPYSCKFANVVLNVAIHDPYPVLPRWTYKWTMGTAGYIGYGTWRGWSAPGYVWTGGWTLLDPPMAALIRQFMVDAQVEYQARFGGLIGPFMPRYGRASWEALNQEGIVGPTGVFTSNTYNQWYFPWDDSLTDVSLSGDWYGYTCRAILSCAADYYLSPTPQIQTVLDNWVEWLMQGERSLTDPITWDSRKVGTYGNGDKVIGIVWDVDHWHPPSEYVANGTVRYHYNPIYSYACIAQAMIFKYWTDGDARAKVILDRMFEYMDTQQVQANGTISLEIREADDSGTRYVSAGPGCLVIAQRGEEGSGYTTATVTITGDGTGAAIVPRIFGGRIRFYEILSVGSGYTHIEATVSGDGTGATVCLALYDQLVGAFDLWHTGWEVWEIYNTYAMRVLGMVPGGNVNFILESEPKFAEAISNLEAFFARNRKDTYPMMQLANYLPMHEFGGWDPYHNGDGFENPMVRDSRTRGKLWTETTGPAMRAGVFYRLLHP